MTWKPSSPRQERCAGLERRYYPAYLRDLVDHDYDDKLPLAERQWLAAFDEEFYRGWRVKGERQLMPLAMLREAGASKERQRRDVQQGAPGFRSLEAMPAHQVDRAAFREAAERAGLEPSDPRALGRVEDELIDALDRRRLVERAVESAAEQVPGMARRRPRAGRGGNVETKVEEPKKSCPHGEVKKHGHCRACKAPAAAEAPEVESDLERAARLVREARGLSPALLAEVRKALAA